MTKILPILIAFMSFVSFSQVSEWEVLPDMSQRGNAGWSMAGMDGSIYYAADTARTLPGDYYSLSKFDGVEWSTHQDFGSPKISDINDVFVNSLNDTTLIISVDYTQNDELRTRILTYSEDSTIILSDYRTPHQLFYVDCKKFMVNSKGLLYLDKLNQNSQDDTLIFVLNFQGNTDTIHKFIVEAKGPFEHATANGFIIYAGGYIGSMPHPDCHCYFDYKTMTFSSKSPGSNVGFFSNAIYTNGSITTTTDGPFTDKSQLQRRVLLFDGTSYSMIGDPTFEKTFNITEYNGNAYLNATKSEDQGVSHIYKYDGVNYEKFSDVSFDYDNGNGDTSSTNPRLYAYMDKLYAFGVWYNLIDKTVSVNSTARINVYNNVNLPPVANDDNFTLQTDTVSIRLKMRANDTEPNGDYLYSTVVNVKHGEINIHPSQDFIYKPELGFLGTDTIEYQVCDVGGLCDNAFVYVTIAHSDVEEIQALNDTLHIMESEVVNFDVSQNDNYGSQSYDIELTDYPKNGQLEVKGMGQYEYTPEKNFFGVDSLKYTVLRSYGYSQSAWAIINVSFVNVPPVAYKDNYTAVLEYSIIDLVKNDVDMDGDILDIEIINGPYNSFATAIIVDETSIEYKNTNVPALIRDSLNYKVCDPYGECDSTWLIIWENRAPIAMNDTVNVVNYSTFIFPKENDFEPDGHKLTINIIAGPYFVGAVTSNCNSECIHYVNNNFSNMTRDSIVYTVSDDYGKSDTAVVYLLNQELTTEELASKAFNVYPNPLRDILFVDFINQQNSTRAYVITDPSGKVLREGIYTSQGIELKQLPKGFYFVQIVDNNRSVISSFIKY
jgi:hypothetical protein